VTWVKICGLTRQDDVSVALEAGADAVGFILSEHSPRNLTLREARRLADGIPALRVLVTVDMALDDALDALAYVGADALQPHGLYSSVAARAARERGYVVLRPVAVADSVDLSAVPVGQIPLLDTHHPDRQGGTGTPFDWQRAVDIERRFILAGGLSPDNVGRAIRTLKPWGVDASSRLEQAPGIKDPGKVTAFVEEAKRQ
jgi:phosphoribosylanthranilate isomerase